MPSELNMAFSKVLKCKKAKDHFTVNRGWVAHYLGTPWAFKLTKDIPQTLSALIIVKASDTKKAGFIEVVIRDLASTKRFWVKPVIPTCYKGKDMVISGTNVYLCREDGIYKGRLSMDQQTLLGTLAVMAVVEEVKK